VFVAIAVACVLAAEEVDRAKKDTIFGGYPYAVPGMSSVGVDDGKYYPGKYDAKPAVAPTLGAYPYNYGAYPYGYNYGAQPYGYNYGSHPYTYGSYPYNYGAHPYAHGSYPYNINAVACVLAAEERVKKDVIVNGVRIMGIDERGYDDGSYYPGKYEVPTFAHAYGAYPYAYGAWSHGWANPWAARTIVY
ncbi:hypothetical protein AAG570_000542, partial [Ranatra chinensis]